MAALEKQYHEELKKEVTGSTVVEEPVVAEGEDSDPDATNKKIAEENADMPTLMMSRKKRKIYKAMQVHTVYIYHSFFFFCW